MSVEEQARVLGRIELAEHDRGVQPLCGSDELWVDTEADECLAHEVAERVGPDLREHGCTPTQAGRPDSHVGCRATEVLGERRDVLERTVLLGVDVDTDSTNGQQVECVSRSSVGAHHDPT